MFMDLFLSCYESLGFSICSLLRNRSRERRKAFDTRLPRVRVHIAVPTSLARYRRQAAARDASATGGNGDAYWHQVPQPNTVGYLTTTAGAMLAGYAIGWLTGTFTMPFERRQMNLCAPYLDVTDQKQTARPGCACRRARGWADHGMADALITPLQHWFSA